MEKNEKLIVVRIWGDVKLNPDTRMTFRLLGLKKKFWCTIVDNSGEKMGMLKKVQEGICYGKANADVLKEMIIKRAKTGKKQAKIEEKKVDDFVKKFMEGKGKMSELGINNVFALHPPRGGFKKSSKLLYPKGILGKNEKVNELISRMI
ncbi:MAG: uL30 family ribosomal protein [Candidatus Paceibacterota bacterium]